MGVSIFGGLISETAPLPFLCAGSKSQGSDHTQGEVTGGEDLGDHKSQLTSFRQALTSAISFPLGGLWTRRLMGQ